jgi:formimidoylglutamase
MESHKMDDFNAQFYRPISAHSWSGRSSEGERALYWHERIDQVDIQAYDTGWDAHKIGLLGYACDEGVRRNKGRVGAVDGPAAIRDQLGKLSFHAGHKTIYDFGDIICQDGQLASSQQSLGAIIYRLLSQSIFPIVLGGGHDIAYGHFLGIHDYVSTTEKSKIGIINFDAHFDLRSVKHGGNSGTPFYQILTRPSAHVSYLPIGIQRQANNQDLFDFADAHDVSYVMIEDCTMSQLENMATLLSSFVEAHDWIYISIDMDGFSSAYAPGVSAPSPLGLSPAFFLKCMSIILSSEKVISCDIAELNPKYDIDSSTARLAAIIVDYIVRHRQIP